MACDLIKITGTKCGSGNGINIIYFRDAQGKWNGERQICQMDSQQVFGNLRRKEFEYKLKIEKLNTLLSVTKDEDKRKHSKEFSRMEKEIVLKLQNEGKMHGIRSKIDRDIRVVNEMEKEIYRRIKRFAEIRQNHRNQDCRLCLHPLTCNCEQCQDRHIGDKISSATLFSQNGYRRDTFNFHILCGRLFLKRFGVDIVDLVSKQMKIKEVMGVE